MIVSIIIPDKIQVFLSLCLFGFLRIFFFLTLLTKLSFSRGNYSLYNFLPLNLDYNISFPKISSSWFECQHPTWHVTCKSRHRILVHCRCKWLVLLARTGSNTNGFSDTDDTHAQPCTRARDRTGTTLNCRKYRQLLVRCPQATKYGLLLIKRPKCPVKLCINLQNLLAF